MSASKQSNGRSSVLVSERQKGNPVLHHINTVTWEYGAIAADYVMGETTAALFLSLKYHMQNPRYIQMRFDQCARQYTTRVLLVLIDMEEGEKYLQDVTCAAIFNNWTVIIVASSEEAARYIETFKVYEKKPADFIREKVDEQDVKGKFHELLTMIKGINKNDVAALAMSYNTFAELCNATPESLATCPGMGHTKVKRIWAALHGPLVSSANAQLAQPPSSRRKATTGASSHSKPKVRDSGSGYPSVLNSFTSASKRLPVIDDQPASNELPRKRARRFLMQHVLDTPEVEVRSLSCNNSSVKLDSMGTGASIADKPTMMTKCEHVESVPEKPGKIILDVEENTDVDMKSVLKKSKNLASNYEVCDPKRRNTAHVSDSDDETWMCTNTLNNEDLIKSTTRTHSSGRRSEPRVFIEVD